MQGMATGAAFDVTAAVRLLAGEVVRLAAEVQALRAACQAGPGGAGQPAPAVEPVGLDLLARLGSQRLTLALVGAGYTTAEQVQAAPDEELLAIDGIGPAALAQIRKRLGE